MYLFKKMYSMDKHNKVLTDSEEISRLWTEYCAEMYDGPTTKIVQMDLNGEELEPLISEVEWTIINCHLESLQKMMLFTER